MCLGQAQDYSRYIPDSNILKHLLPDKEPVLQFGNFLTNHVVAQNLLGFYCNNRSTTGSNKLSSDPLDRFFGPTTHSTCHTHLRKHSRNHLLR